MYMHVSVHRYVHMYMYMDMYMHLYVCTYTLHHRSSSHASGTRLPYKQLGAGLAVKVPISARLTLIRVQSTQIWNIYGLYTRNRDNGFGNVVFLFGYLDPLGKSAESFDKKSNAARSADWQQHPVTENLPTHRSMAYSGA